MDKNDMTKELKERLHWYIYDSSYYDYNQQEVDYIIDYLKNHDVENEAKIEESGVIITPFDRVRGISKPKAKTLKTISSIIVAAVLIISILPIHDAIAGIKRGKFIFIQKDENSATMLMPSSELIKRYKTYEQLEEPFNNKIWKLDETFDWYKLRHIKIRGENIIYQHFDDANNNTIALTYGENYSVENYNVTEKTNYKNIFIDFVMNDEVYYAFFSVSNINYSVETTDKSVIKDVAFRFVDFLCK